MDRNIAFGLLLAIANVLSERIYEKDRISVSQKYWDAYKKKPFETLVKIHADLHEYTHKFGENELQLLDLFGEILSSLEPDDQLNESLKPSYLHGYYSQQDALNHIMGTEDASNLWGLSQDHIKRLCRDGKVKATLIGKTWIIDKNQDSPKK